MPLALLLPRCCHLLSPRKPRCPVRPEGYSPFAVAGDYSLSIKALLLSEVSPHQVDLGVDLNKSTWVDLRTSSRVGSVLPGAVDSKSNLEMKSDFTASRL